VHLLPSRTLTRDALTPRPHNLTAQLTAVPAHQGGDCAHPQRRRARPGHAVNGKAENADPARVTPPAIPTITLLSRPTANLSCPRRP